MVMIKNGQKIIVHLMSSSVQLSLKKLRHPNLINIWTCNQGVVGSNPSQAKIQLTTEPKVSFKSKNGFNKKWSVTNCASDVKVYS